MTKQALMYVVQGDDGQRHWVRVRGHGHCYEIIGGPLDGSTFATLQLLGDAFLEAENARAIATK